MSTHLYRLAKWCYSHRRRVLAGWIMVGIAALTAGMLWHGTENDNITIPGTESQQVASLLKDKVPAFSGGQTQVVFVAHGTATVTGSAQAAAIQKAVTQMDHVAQVAEVNDPISTKTISTDHQAALTNVLWDTAAGNVHDSSLTALQRAAAPAQAAGLQVAFGGQVYPGWDPKTSETPEIAGIAIAFVILLITFGAFVAAGIPILSAILGVLIAVSGITALASVLNIATVSTTVAIMLGLSTGIDYGLFISSRHRSQVLAGEPLEESVATSVGTAGSSVVFAGSTVIVALIGLSVVGIPFLRTMGLLAAGAVAISVLISLTLLPAILGFAGNKVTRFVHLGSRPGRPERIARLSALQPERTAGARWARFVVRHSVAVLVAGIAALVTIASPIKDLHLGLPSGASQPESSTARQAYDLTTRHFGVGFNGALLVVADPVTDQQSQAIAGRLASVPDVLAAKPVAYANRTAVIQVIPKTGPVAQTTTTLVNRLRSDRTELAGSTGTQLLVGGPTASNIDVSKKLSSTLPIFLITIVGLAFFLLTFAFRTVLVPVKSILGFLLSIAGALGAQVALFQWGWGAGLLGITKSQVSLSYLPTILMAIIFGLSSDYEVFVVSRIKEQFTKTGDARVAAQRGTGVSVRVVSAAALIMFSIFVAFMTSSNVAVRPIAFSFAIGVFLDAFVVRLTLVPAVMALVGNRFWYHPKWFARYVPDPDIEGERLAERLAHGPAAAPETVAAR